MVLEFFVFCFFYRHFSSYSMANDGDDDDEYNEIMSKMKKNQLVHV